MADFCKQCSTELFGEDFGDLKGIGELTPEQREDGGWGFGALCEGCGSTLVDEAGQCILRNCLKKHGVQ